MPSSKERGAEGDAGPASPRRRPSPERRPGGRRCDHRPDILSVKGFHPRRSASADHPGLACGGSAQHPFDQTPACSPNQERGSTKSTARPSAPVDIESILKTTPRIGQALQARRCTSKYRRRSYGIRYRARTSAERAADEDSPALLHRRPPAAVEAQSATAATTLPKRASVILRSICATRLDRLLIAAASLGLLSHWLTCLAASTKFSAAESGAPVFKPILAWRSTAWPY